MSWYPIVYVLGKYFWKITMQIFPLIRIVQKLTELFNTHYKGVPLPTKPGIRELLSYLQEQDIKVGLASSTAQHLVRDEIGTAGLLPYFQTLVCGDMVEHSKPAPDIFLKACEILNADPHKVHCH